MTFDFNFTKEDHYQFLIKSKRRNLWIWTILYTVFYFFFVYYLIKKSILTVLSIYLISIVILYIFFRFINILMAKMVLKYNEKECHSYGKYHVTINDKKITSKVNSLKYEYTWLQIKTINIKKDAIYILPRRGKIMLFLPRKCIGDTLFNEIKEYLKDIIIN